MKALLDTNIIIHRETMQATNYTIGKLYYWLDKLHYEKLIHPYTMDELKKYQNEQVQDLYDAKLSAYIKMTTIAAGRTISHLIRLFLRSRNNGLFILFIV